MDIEENYEKFCTWLEEKPKDLGPLIIDKNMVENIYIKSREKLLKIKDYEDALVSFIFY